MRGLWVLLLSALACSERKVSRGLVRMRVRLMQDPWCLPIFLAWNIGLMGAELGVGILTFRSSSAGLRKQVQRMLVFPLSLVHAISFAFSVKNGAYVATGNFMGFCSLGFICLSQVLGRIRWLDSIIVVTTAGMHCFQVHVCACLLRRLVCHRLKQVPVIDSLKDAFHFSVVVLLGSFGFQALITLLHCVCKVLAWSNFFLHWITWSMGALSAIVSVSPLIIHSFVWKPQRKMFQPTKVLEASFLGVSTVGLLVLVYVFAIRTYFKPLPYLLFPSLVHSAFRFNRIGWAVILSLISLFCTWTTAQERGALFTISGVLQVEPRLIIQIQLFVSVTSAVAISLAAAVREKQQLAKKLERMNENLESLVGQKTFQLTKANEELKASHAALERASKAKTDFLANMSHEIRTPIHGILGMATLLLETELTDDQTESMKTLRGCGEMLLHIINNILDLAKIEAGRFEVEIVGFNLYRVVNKTVYMLKPRARECNLELKLDIDKDVPELVQGDCGKLQQCLTNIVGNAMKFTKSGVIALEVSDYERMKKEDPVLSRAEGSEGLVEITNTQCVFVPPHFGSSAATPECVYEDAPKANVVFKITDTGIGVSKEKFQEIFKPFSQADASISRLYGGAGLGLSIVQRFVELMGGHILAASEAGVGSTFYIVLPFYLKDEMLPNEEAAATSVSQSVPGPTSAPAITDSPAQYDDFLFEDDSVYTLLSNEIDDAPMEQHVLLDAEGWEDTTPSVEEKDYLQARKLDAEAGKEGKEVDSQPAERRDGPQTKTQGVSECRTPKSDRDAASTPTSPVMTIHVPGIQGGSLTLSKEKPPTGREDVAPPIRIPGSSEKEEEARLSASAPTVAAEKEASEDGAGDGAPNARRVRRADLVIDIDALEERKKKQSLESSETAKLLETEKKVASTNNNSNDKENAGRYRVLLVEDNIVNQKVATRLLQRFGHSVTLANDGVQAVDAVEANREAFDLVLMDIQMPNMDGLEATRQIREQESKVRRRRLPIIGLTAHAMQGYQDVCFAAGMDAYLPKPFDIKQVLAIIRMVVNSPRELHITIKDITP